MEPEDPDTGIVIEVKYAPTLSGLESTCQKAIDQIRERHCQERLANDGRTSIKAYGITFCKKILCNIRGTVLMTVPRIVRGTGSVIYLPDLLCESRNLSPDSLTPYTRRIITIQES
ncbi:MAG: PD-(D/E)XK nuclease domain-containing protein [Lachnospiraceae bacterium]|nr:PD-(D/E)XK nuclease domain-containing protein [Lachnospiraceae bacterium]